MSVRQIAQSLQSGSDKQLQQVGLAIKLLSESVSSSSGSSSSSSSSGGSASGSTDPLIAAPTGLTATASNTDTDGILAVVLNGTLPIDENMAGIRFIVERPASGDVDAEHLTLPGELLNDVPVLYTAGDGGAFSTAFRIPKPNGAQRILIYTLPFSESYENPFVRLEQHDPELPADVTPFAVLDIGTGLTVSGSELGDILLTGPTVLTPSGIGTLKIHKQYVPPYLAGPLPAIGDFQGVDIWYVDPTGKSSLLDSQAYQPPVAFDADPPGNLGSIEVSIPMPEVGSTVYLVVCAYSTTKHLPFREPDIAPAGIVLQVDIDEETTSGGLATQVGAFTVTVQSSSPAGVAAGAKQGNFHITYNRPIDTKWKGTWIDRVFTDAAFTPLSGETWSEPVFSSTGVLDLGPWPWPTTAQYFIYRSRSVNFDDEPNNVAFPQEFVQLNADGTFVLANNAIAGAMLQDLAVTARALSDYVVQTRHYAPLSIPTAAIGIAAVNDANIANLSLGKLTPTAGAANIEASGGIVFSGGGYTVGITPSGVETNGSFISYGGLACQGTSILTYGAGTPDFIVEAVGVQINRFANPTAVIASLLPGYGGHSGQFLKTDGSGLMWDTPGGSGSGVSSFIGRTGAVVAAPGDYSASQISGLGTAATANLGTGGSDAAYGSHSHTGVYAPAEYYPGQTVNNQLYYLTNDLDAGLSVTVNPATLTSMTFTNGRMTAYA